MPAIRPIALLLLKSFFDDVPQEVRRPVAVNLDEEAAKLAASEAKGTEDDASGLTAH